LTVEKGIDEHKEVPRDYKYQIKQLKEENENIKKKTYASKTFPICSVLIIIIAIICLLSINSQPWADYQMNLGGQRITASFYRDFRIEGTHTNWGFFDLPYVYQIGITRDDFTNIPNYTYYSVLFMMLLSVLLIILWVLDRIRNYSSVTYYTINSIVYLLMILPCVITIHFVLRFINTYFLIAHHYGFQELIINEILGVEATPLWIFPAPYILLVSGFFVIIISLTMIENGIKRNAKEISDNVFGDLIKRKFKRRKFPTIK